MGPQPPPVAGSVEENEWRQDKSPERVDEGRRKTPEQVPLSSALFLEHMARFTESINSKLAAVEKTAADNSDMIRDQRKTLDNNKASIDGILARLDRIEGGDAARPAPIHPNARSTRAPRSHQYEVARRSVRIWPIPSAEPDEMWAEVGDFLHVTLAIPETDLRQEDIESIKRVRDPIAAGNVRDEVLLTFFDSKARDLVLVSSTNLAKFVDDDGRPTAGTRLEIPPELMDTFRLLSRFGTRLRARHGEGTKRHIKFDDFNASLFCNIKLPGDTTWTKVSPQMARDDLNASFHEENASTQKRLAVKLLPGPRERLRPRPLTSAAAVSRDLSGHRMIAPSALGQPMDESEPTATKDRWTVPRR